MLAFFFVSFPAFPWEEEFGRGGGGGLAALLWTRCRPWRLCLVPAPRAGQALSSLHHTAGRLVPAHGETTGILLCVTKCPCQQG